MYAYYINIESRHAKGILPGVAVDIRWQGGGHERVTAPGIHGGTVNLRRFLCHGRSEAQADSGPRQIAEDELGGVTESGISMTRIPTLRKELSAVGWHVLLPGSQVKAEYVCLLVDEEWHRHQAQCWALTSGRGMGVQFLWKGGPNIWVIVVYGYAGYQGSSDGQAQQTQLLEDIRVHIDQYCRKEDVVLCVGDFNQELEDSRGDQSLHAWAAGCGLGHGASGMTQIPEWFSFMQTGKEGKVRKSLIDHIWTSGEAVAVTQYLISESFLCSDHCLLSIVMEGGGLKC